MWGLKFHNLLTGDKRHVKHFFFKSRLSSGGGKPGQFSAVVISMLA